MKRGSQRKLKPMNVSGTYQTSNIFLRSKKIVKIHMHFLAIVRVENRRGWGRKFENIDSSAG